MTIEYKDSKRITMLSTSSESLLTSSDYTSSNFTTVGSTVAITSNSVVFSSTPSNADNGQYEQITALAESDSYTLDFKLNVSSHATFDNYYLALTNTSGAINSANQLGLQTQGGSYNRFTFSTRISGSSSETASSNGTVSTGTDYYCTLSSDGTTATFKAWTNSGRTGLTSVTLTRPVSGLGTLNYIQHRSRNSGDSNTWSGTVSEVALSKTLDKPTNVQDNTLLIEKDTANRYWFDAPTTVTNQDIEWKSSGSNNVTISGNTLTATAGSWSCIARSVQTISPSRGGGTVIGKHTKNWGMFGFSKDPYWTSGNTFANGDYLIYKDEVYELGSAPSGSQFTGATDNTLYKVTMDSNGLVKYYADTGSGYSEVWESTVTAGANDEYYVLGVPDSSGSTVSDITITGTITPATWTVQPKSFQGVFGLKLRLDASLGVTGSSTASAWADQAPYGDNDFVQATSSNQPTITASNSSFNNKPTIDFDGSNDNMTCTFPTALTDDCSVYIVTNGSAGTDSVYFQGVTSTTYDQITFATNQGGGTKNYISNANATINGTSTASSSAVNTSACIFRLNYELNGKFYKDGTQVNVASNSLKAGIGVASLILGGRGDSGWSHGNIKIAEFLLFDHVLSDADNTLIMTYLEDKYSL